ncbi:MAG: restriction endonuclease [bacterium]
MYYVISAELRFKLSEKEIHELLPGGTQEVLNNRVGWAASYLKKAKLISSSKRGFFNITEKGKEIILIHPQTIDVKYLKTIPEFLEWHNNSKIKKNNSTELTEERILVTKTPEELLEESYALMKEELVSELLEQIKSCTPRFFERLVVDVLIKMGYGGSRKEAGSVIGKSGDGGIDGVINEDKLGLDIIYIQAKKYDATVPIAKVREFGGALLENKGKKGIMITTSDFPKSAFTYIKNIDPRIILIDGVQLANFMIEYNLGVTLKTSYEIKKIDTDYFEE